MAALNRWQWAGWLLGLSALALVGWQLWLHRDQVALAWSGMAAWRLFAAVTLGLVAQLLFALAWHVLIGPGGAGDTLHPNVSRWLVTLAGKYLPGKVWQGVGRVAMYGGEIPAPRVAAVYVREMLLSTSAACAAAASHGMFFPSLLGPASWALAAASVGLALVAHPALARRVQAWLPARLQAAAAPEAQASGRLLLAWSLQLLAYLTLGMALVLVAGGLVPVDVPLAWAITSALCLGGLAGIAAFFVPAGLGVREAMLAGYLAQYIDLGQASLIALLGRGWLTVTEALAIAAGLALARRMAVR